MHVILRYRANPSSASPAWGESLPSADIMASAHGDLRHLLPINYKRQITSWLEEDCPSLDYGGFVVGESEGEAKLLGKSDV